MTTGNESKVTVACVQMCPEVGAKVRNVAHSIELIEEAHARGANLIVLPELCNSGYVFESRKEAFALSEALADGDTIGQWSALAARLGVTLVAGYAERDGDTLYNSAAVIGPGGVLGGYRKMHLWGDEHLFFEPGNLGMPVFHTPFGRVACAICYDIWFPEVFRMAAARGADILCVPTNWVPMPAQPAGLPAMANLLAMGGAHSNGLFVAAADRVGVERDQPFLGRSLIVDSQGWPAAGPASPTDEEILVASVNLADARRHRQLNAFNHVLRDCRPYMYCEGRSIVSVYPLAAFIRPYKRGTLTRHWHIQPNSRFALRLDLTFSHRYTLAVHQRKARGSAPRRHGASGYPPGRFLLWRLQGIIVSHVHYIGSNSYGEYTFVPWLGRAVSRRTVDLSPVCMQ